MIIIIIHSSLDKYMNTEGRDTRQEPSLLSPRDFGNVVMFTECVQVAVELLHLKNLQY